MKRTMVVFTSLYFNKTGNQSFFETIKYYSTYFKNIIIITSYNDDAYYLKNDEIKDDFMKKIKVYRTYNYIKYLHIIIKNLINKNKKIRSNTYNRELKNFNYNWFSILYYYLTNILKFLIFLLLYVKRDIKNIDLVCAYEIGGVWCTLIAKKILLRKVKIIAKMQGTVLFPILKKRQENRIKNYVDHHAYKKLRYFDYITMTNDGTHGDEVLRLYGVPDSKIIFLTNGLPDAIIKKKDQINTTVKKYVDHKLKLMTLSRLIPWKRVDLTIDIANILVNEFKFSNFILDIYGAGTDSDFDNLIEKIKIYNLEKYVYIHGPVPFNLVPDIIMNHDFLISLYSYTNITNPLLEASYLGTGIISIASNDLKQILDETKANIKLIEEKSEKDLCYEIADYIKNFKNIDNTEKKSISNNDRSNKLFSWQERCQKEISIIFK